VMRLEQLPHRPERGVVDFLEIERRVDLGRDALQDLERCRPGVRPLPSRLVGCLSTDRTR
jgi:hypothetical protein